MHALPCPAPTDACSPPALAARLAQARGSMQLDGTLHALGDFRGALGRAVQAPQQSFRGLAVDLCYQPLDDAALAGPMLQVGRVGHALV